MAPQQPTPSPSSANGGQVVTVTVFSTPSSGPSNLPVSSGGGVAGVPIGAIAGGVAGGVTLAVIMVLIWKYWGLVIKRTEKRRRKEAQDILAMRENTRRNAMTRFKPQASLRPILNINPDGPRVKFLARKPTWPRGKKNNNNASNSNNPSPAPAAIPPLPTDEMRVVDREAPTGEFGTDELQQPSPSFASAAPLLEHGPRTEPEQKNESAEQQPEEEATSPPPGIASSPGPSRSPSGRSHSPTPSQATSNHSSSPRPSRSTRMRMPTRLPDPPAAPPIPIRIARAYHARPSVSTPSGLRNSLTPPHSPAAGPHHHAPETPGTPPRSTSPVTVPALPPAPVAGPSTAPSPPPRPLSTLTLSNSPLRYSVLPSERPVIMPRAKNAGPTSPSASRPSSPTSTWGDAPTLPSHASQVSAGSREPSARHEYPDSLSHGKPPTEMVGENARQASMSSHSAPSAYSND